MCVEMIGDLTHLAVKAPATLPETGISGLAQAGEHVVDRGLVWIDPVDTPHHHWCVAHFTIRNPADIIFEVPGGQLRSFTELAGSLEFGHWTQRFTTLPILTLVPTTGLERNTVPLGGPYTAPT